jgi:hypothetical protein
MLTLIGTAFKSNGTVSVDSGTPLERTCDWNVAGGVYNDTLIVCAVPPAVGAAMMVIVVRAMHVESVPYAGVGYLPPQIAALSPGASNTDGGVVLNISGASA